MNIFLDKILKHIYRFIIGALVIGISIASICWIFIAGMTVLNLFGLEWPTLIIAIVYLIVSYFIGRNIIDDVEGTNGN
jgi:hypothetical protein